MSQEEVEKLKQSHEDAAIKKLRDALPTVHVKDLRRTLKEYDGDAEKVFDFWTGVVTTQNSQVPPPTTDETPSNDATAQAPEFIPESPTDLQQETLSRSLEILSLNPEPVQGRAGGGLPKEDSPDVPSFETEQQDDLKEKARIRRQVSAARKQRLAKKEQKEAAKRRKHMQTLGTEKMDDTIGTAAQEHVLKAIVI
jgi:hypothetical protein